MPNYYVQIIDKHEHENNKHMLSYTFYFDKSGRTKRPIIDKHEHDNNKHILSYKIWANKAPNNRQA